MTDDTRLLVTTLSDALTGKPVKLGFMDAPRVLRAIDQLKHDTPGRLEAFDDLVRVCLRDPVLGAHLRSLVQP